jgi:hypothetical protein
VQLLLYKQLKAIIVRSIYSHLLGFGRLIIPLF